MDWSEDMPELEKFMEAANKMFDPSSVGRAVWCFGASRNAHALLKAGKAPDAAMRTVVVWWCDGNIDGFIHPAELSTAEAFDVLVSEVDTALNEGDLSAAVVIAFDGEGMLSTPRYKENSNG